MSATIGAIIATIGTIIVSIIGVTVSCQRAERGAP